MAITPEQARAELARRETASQSQPTGSITSEQAQAELARRQSIEQPFEATTSDKARLAAQGASFGFADELEGAITASGKKIGSEVFDLFNGTDTARDLSDIYALERDAIRSENQEFRDNAPLEALGYELGGGVATAFIPGAGAANLARLGSGAVKVLSTLDKVNQLKNVAKIGVNAAKNSRIVNNPLTRNAPTLLAQGVASGVGYNEDTDKLMDDVVRDGLLSLVTGKAVQGITTGVSKIARNSPLTKGLFNDTSSVMGDAKVSQDLQNLVKTGQLTEESLMNAYTKKAGQLKAIGSTRSPQLADFDEFQGLVTTANRQIDPAANLSGKAGTIGADTGETIADAQAVRASEIQDSLIDTVDPRVAEPIAGLEADNAIRAEVAQELRNGQTNLTRLEGETDEEFGFRLFERGAQRGREALDPSGVPTDSRFTGSVTPDGRQTTGFALQPDEILDSGRVNFQRLNDNVTKNLSKEVDPLYKSAYATKNFGFNQLPTSLTSNDVFKDAVKAGKIAAQNKINAKGGTKVPSNFQVLDFTKRHLDSIGKSRTASPSEKADATALRNQLVEPMRAASPDYAKALDAQAAVYSELGSITRGKDLFGTSEENALDILDGITNQDAGAVAAGYGREMTDTILSSKGVNNINDTAVSDTSLDRLGKMVKAFENPKALQATIEGGLNVNQKALRAAYLAGKAPKGQQSLFDRLNNSTAKDAEFAVAATSFARQPKLSSLYYTVRSLGQAAAARMTPKEVIQHMQRTLHKDLTKDEFAALLTGNLDQIPYEKWDKLMKTIGTVSGRAAVTTRESSNH